MDEAARREAQAHRARIEERSAANAHMRRQTIPRPENFTRIDGPLVEPGFLENVTIDDFERYMSQRAN